MKAKRNRRRVLSLLKFVLLAVYFIAVTGPLLWILLTSFKDKQSIYVFPVRYLPRPFVLDNYAELFRIARFGRYFLNSVAVSAVGAGLAMILAIMGGYAMARFRFKGRSALMLGFLITQMIPMFVILAPLYELMGKLRLINRLPALMILYMAMLIPYCTITLRGFFQRIPNAIEEAAMIDGCSRLRSLIFIILPVMATGIASTFLFAFVQCWNEIFLAIMFIDSEELKTIPVAINAFIMKFDINWGALTAGMVVSTLPAMLVFAYIQKYIAGGLTAGSVKE
jgi:multiple sugar transport system permease protein